MRPILYRGVFCALFAVLFLTSGPVRARDGAGDGLDHFGNPEEMTKWSFPTRGAVTASPVLSEDGLTLYVGSADRHFYAINTEDGSLKWKTNLNSAISASAVMDGENIYVPCANGRLYNLSDAGDRALFRWAKPFRGGRAGLSSPAVGEDGTIYVGCDDHRLYALNPEDGSVKSPFPFRLLNDAGTPVISSSGTIYITAGARLFGVSEAAAQVSVFAPGAAIHSTPALGEDDQLYFGSNDERVYALDSGGTTNDLIWKFNTGENVTSSPVVGAGGDVFIGSERARLYCFRTNGVLRWSVRTKRPVRAALSIGADGTIYAGSDDRHLYAVSAEGEVRWKFKTGGAVRSAAAIDAEGTVYFGSRDKSIYAVYDEATADENIWPMFRHDPQHTARSTHGAAFIFQDPLGTNVSKSFLSNNLALGQTKFLVTNGVNFLTVTNQANVLVSIVARAGAPFAIQWTHDGVDMNPVLNRSATNATLVLTNIQFADAGQYSVRLENSFDEIESSEPFTLDVNASPSIELVSTNRFLLSSNVLVLEATVTGSGTFTFQWFRGTNSLPGATNATYAVTNALPSDSGLYSVRVVNEFGATTSPLITVTVLNNDHPVAPARLGAGQRHSHAVLEDGTLWSWGLENFGQLGNNVSGSSGTNLLFLGTPQLIGADGGRSTNAVWLGVTAGGRGFDVATNQPGGFSLGLQTNGTLWAWGHNHAGQLGLGHTTVTRVPAQVGSSSNWMQVEAGATHTLALQSDGTLWSWGANESGQLGQGNTNRSLTPARVGTESAWVEVGAGGFFSLARRADGSIWGWGANTANQLGLTPATNRFTPTRIGTNAHWSSLSAGLFHSLAATTNGALWAWGRGSAGQLGSGSTTNRATPIRIGTNNYWTAVEAGLFHSFALQTGGVLHAWGANTNGQLGLSLIGSGSEVNVRVPTPVPANASNTAWVEIQASRHSVARDVAGNVWAWGFNSHGQVGNNLTNNALSPVLLSFTNPPVFINAPGIFTQPTSLTVLESNSATFSINATGAAPIFYHWYFNSNAIAPTANNSATNALFNLASAQGTNQGFYFVIVSNSLGSVTSSVVRLTVTNSSGTNLQAPVITQQPVSRVATVSNSVSFTVAATGVPAVSYQWYFSNSLISSATNATSTAATLVLTNSFEKHGFYHVVVSNSMGRATSVVVSLTLTNAEGFVFLPDSTNNSGLAISNSRPFITLAPTNQSALTNATVFFTVEVLGAAPLIYQWRFNSNVISVLVNETATNATLALSNVVVTHSGFYDVVITNEVGSITSAPVRLTVTNGVVNITPGLASSAKSAAVELRLDSITRDANGVLIQINSGGGHARLVLEYKEELGEAEWKPVGTNDGGIWQFRDATAPLDRARYYRVRAE